MAIPISYNIRNLIVRKATTLMTAAAANGFTVDRMPGRTLIRRKITTAASATISSDTNVANADPTMFHRGMRTTFKTTLTAAAVPCTAA